ncbi:MAG: hypothetical protein ACXWHG_14810, partial [Thermoanaerobaculia bacterium]
MAPLRIIETAERYARRIDRLRRSAHAPEKRRSHVQSAQFDSEQVMIDADPFQFASPLLGLLNLSFFEVE